MEVSIQGKHSSGKFMRWNQNNHCHGNAFTLDSNMIGVDLWGRSTVVLAGLWLIHPSSVIDRPLNWGLSLLASGFSFCTALAWLLALSPCAHPWFKNLCKCGVFWPIEEQVNKHYLSSNSMITLQIFQNLIGQRSSCQRQQLLKGHFWAAGCRPENKQAEKVTKGLPWSSFNNSPHTKGRIWTLILMLVQSLHGLLDDQTTLHCLWLELVLTLKTHSN